MQTAARLCHDLFRWGIVIPSLLPDDESKRNCGMIKNITSSDDTVLR